MALRASTAIAHTRLGELTIAINRLEFEPV